jgi:hypothetical protein
MMTIPGTLALVLATGLLATPALASPRLASPVETHSGILTAIDPAHHTATLSEMGPWKGPTTARVSRTIAISPATQVELVQRSAKPAVGGWPGGYRESPLTIAQLHAGEFATLRVTGHGWTAVAESIEVLVPTTG